MMALKRLAESLADLLNGDFGRLIPLPGAEGLFPDIHPVVALGLPDVQPYRFLQELLLGIFSRRAHRFKSSRADSCNRDEKTFSIPVS